MPLITIKQQLVFLSLGLDFTSILYLLGLFGLLVNRRNLLLMLLCLELTFLASALNFIIVSSLLNLTLGSIYGILVILLVVADTAIGLSLVVLGYRGFKIVTIDSLISLRG